MGEQHFALQNATSRDAWRAAILLRKIATSPLRVPCMSLFSLP
jgi:hypothetical protein